jgi:hypothetical protein
LSAKIIKFNPYGVQFEQRENHCSFCGIHKDKAGRMIRGTSAFICDVCLKKCNDLIKGNENVGPAIA